MRTPLPPAPAALHLLVVVFSDAFILVPKLREAFAYVMFAAWSLGAGSICFLVQRVRSGVLALSSPGSRTTSSNIDLKPTDVVSPSMPIGGMHSTLQKFGGCRLNEIVFDLRLLAAIGQGQ